MKPCALLAVAAAAASALSSGCASPRSPDFMERVGAASLVAKDRAVYRRYHGKYTGDPRLTDGMDRVEKALPAAEERVRRRLGVPSLAFPPFAVCFVDGEGSGTDGSMETGLVAGDGKDVCVVAVVAEDLVTGLYDEERTLAHELTHVLHISGGEGAKAPLWLAEGMARWVETEDEASRKDLLLPFIAHGPGSQGIPISKLLEDESALEGREEDLQVAAGSVVFFQLEWSRGTEAVRRLIVRLLRERDWRTVFREETGRPVDALFKEVRAAYLEWGPKAYPGLEELTRLDEGRPAESLAALDAFLAEHPGGPVGTLGKYFRARYLRLAGDPEGSLAALRAFRRDHPRHFVAMATLFEEAEVLRELEDWHGVAALCRLLLLDYLWSPARADERKNVEARLEEAVGRIRTGAGAPGAMHPRE